MALQGCKQIMEWENQFGRDERFKYLIHSDEKIFEFNPSDHMGIRYILSKPTVLKNNDSI